MTGPDRQRRGRRVAAVAVATLLGVLLDGAVTGCGSDAHPSPPTGVDGLQIPLADPDPADFVGGVDNPYLSYLPGTVWRYRVTGATGAHPRTRTVTVGAAPVVVDGVATTAVRSVVTGSPATTDFYAQDAAGNVWWFGEVGVWQAGLGGAQAGLAMAAHPRLGDGYPESRAGVADTGGVDAEVLASDLTVANPDRSWEHTVLVETTRRDPEDPTSDQGLVQRYWYAPGTGLVRQDTEVGPVQLQTLVSVTRAG